MLDKAEENEILFRKACEKITEFQSRPETCALSSTERVMVAMATGTSQSNPIVILLKLDQHQLRAVYKAVGKGLDMSDADIADHLGLSPI